MQSWRAPHPASERALSALLSADHARLDRLFEELREAFRTETYGDAARLWTLFEQGLVAHLAMEDDFILPELAKVAPEEAARLRREHDDIREKLGLLKLGTDWRPRAEAIDAFVATLRHHAAREDEVMHPWSDVGLSPSVREDIAARLTRSESIANRMRGTG